MNEYLYLIHGKYWICLVTRSQPGGLIWLGSDTVSHIPCSTPILSDVQEKKITHSRAILVTEAKEVDSVRIIESLRFWHHFLVQISLGVTQLLSPRPLGISFFLNIAQARCGSSISLFFPRLLLPGRGGCCDWARCEMTDGASASPSCCPPPLVVTGL